MHLVSWASVVVALQLPRCLLGSRERTKTQWLRTPLRYNWVFTWVNTLLSVCSAATLRASDTETQTNIYRLKGSCSLSLFKTKCIKKSIKNLNFSTFEAKLSMSTWTHQCFAFSVFRPPHLKTWRFNLLNSVFPSISNLTWAFYPNNGEKTKT